MPNRREFLRSLPLSVAHWIPGLGLLGFRVHRYVNPLGAGWYGWITSCGKLVGFMKLNRTIQWWP